ncbi:MAG: SDR family NAD(P)-dependent oxidoreductase [Verrucomicrobiales bacterium]
MQKERVLITGASSGIGLELAHQFAMHGHPVALVAPVESELQSVASEITQKYHVAADVIAADLTQPGAPDQIYARATAKGSVDILVNNAGLGQKGNFWETPLDRDIMMIRVNVEAVIRLTKNFLPPMINRKSGRILNTASIAGFEPGPLLAVYHATKAFVLSWSEALATELQETGVTLTALCPGPTDTDFFEKADMTQTRVAKEMTPMDPRVVAEAGYKACMKGERIIVPGAMNKTLVFSRRFMSESAQAKMNQRFYEDVEESGSARAKPDQEYRTN